MAAAGVVGYVLLRSPQGSQPAAPTPGPAAPDAAGAEPREAVTPDAVLPIRRTLPGDGGVEIAHETSEPTRPPSLAFERELRDTGWANEQEKELTLRLRGVVDRLAARDTPIDIDAIECRHSQCKVVVHARDAAALGQFYAALETSEGLYGWADNLLLAPVETAPDGSVTTHVVALFERD